VGLTPRSGADILVVAVALIANVLWIWCGAQTLSAIRALTSIYVSRAEDPIDQVVRESLKWSPRLMRSSYILGIHLPTVVALAWLFGFAMLLSRP
jgi:hypothetical protein